MTMKHLPLFGRLSKSRGRKEECQFNRGEKDKLRFKIFHCGAQWAFSGALMRIRIASPKIFFKRQRPNRDDAQEGRIPKGFRPKAQSCEERATLGQNRAWDSTLKGLRPRVAACGSQSAECHNPLGVGQLSCLLPPSTSFL